MVQIHSPRLRFATTWSGSSPFAATCSYKDLGLQCWTPLLLPLPLLTPRQWTHAEAVIAAFSCDNVAGRHSHMVAESSHRREDALEGAPEGRSANERYRARSPQAGESALGILTDAERSSGSGRDESGAVDGNAGRTA